MKYSYEMTIKRQELEFNRLGRVQIINIAKDHIAGKLIESILSANPIKEDEIDGGHVKLSAAVVVYSVEEIRKMIAVLSLAISASKGDPTMTSTLIELKREILKQQNS